MLPNVWKNSICDSHSHTHCLVHSLYYYSNTTDSNAERENKTWNCWLVDIVNFANRGAHHTKKAVGVAFWHVGCKFDDHEPIEHAWRAIYIVDFDIAHTIKCCVAVYTLLPAYSFWLAIKIVVSCWTRFVIDGDTDAIVITIGWRWSWEKRSRWKLFMAGWRRRWSWHTAQWKINFSNISRCGHFCCCAIRFNPNARIGCRLRTI